MDRDQHKDPNSQGPGIYWTSDLEQAKSYAHPKGFIHVAKIPTSKLLKDTTPKPDREDVEWLIEKCDNPNGFLSNWGFGDGMTDRDQALAQAVNTYCNYADAMIDACVSVYHDAYGRTDADLWAYNMVRMGVDAYLHRLPDVWHLIVYNPKVIKLVKAYKLRETKAK